MKLLIIAIALGVSNFAYQMFTGHNWSQAVERTFFQAVAILCVYLCL